MRAGFAPIMERRDGSMFVSSLAVAARMGKLGLAALVVVALALAAACSQGGEAYPAAPASAPAAAAPAPAQPTTGTAAAQAARGQTQNQAAAAAAPAQPTPVSLRTDMDVFDLDTVQASLVQRQRVIIRTVDMAMVVSDAARAVDEVAAAAREFGGWTVAANRASTHSASVSVRVPAQSLEDAVFAIRRVGVKVVSEKTNSQDVTDEYVDSQSRLASLRATEQSLLRLFERADDVEKALAVQDRLAELQANIETILGRIRLMEETAAFSLINVSVALAPMAMSVDAGGDRTVSAGEAARFQAKFTPPDGIDAFTFAWDFGDHTPEVSGTRHAPTGAGGGERSTATVSHAYASDVDSPYIVRLRISGTGEAGLAEGAATFRTTVKKIPTIEVYAGTNRRVEQGQAAEYAGSFTRSSELSNFRYTWDFGDGSAPIDGLPEPDESRVTVTHVFENFRPQPYPVTFTVRADGDAGEVSGAASFDARVYESEGLVIAGWSAGKNFKSATRALSAVLQVIGTALIWLLTFSPIWGGAILAVFGIIRALRWLESESAPSWARRGRRGRGRYPPRIEAAPHEDESARTLEDSLRNLETPPERTEGGEGGASR